MEEPNQAPAADRAAHAQGQPALQEQRRIQRALQLRAALWALFSERLILHGITASQIAQKPRAPDGGTPLPPCARAPEHIARALRAHWSPIFSDKAVSKPQIDQFLVRVAPRIPMADL